MSQDLAAWIQAVAAVGSLLNTLMQKTSQLNVRITPELRAEVDAACEKTGLDPAIAVRECLKAFVVEVQATGEIRLPLAIVPKSDWIILRGELPPPYGKKEGAAAPAVLCPGEEKLPTQPFPARSAHSPGTRGSSTPAHAGGDEGLIAEKPGAYRASEKPRKKR